LPRKAREVARVAAGRGEDPAEVDRAVAGLDRAAEVEAVLDQVVVARDQVQAEAVAGDRAGVEQVPVAALEDREAGAVGDLAAVVAARRREPPAMRPLSCDPVAEECQVVRAGLRARVEEVEGAAAPLACGFLSGVLLKRAAPAQRRVMGPLAVDQKKWCGCLPATPAEEDLRVRHLLKMRLG
jgi:hypothetical protein